MMGSVTKMEYRIAPNFVVQNFREIAGNPININFRDRYIFS